MNPALVLLGIPFFLVIPVDEQVQAELKRVDEDL
jgi:hypothetical protein